MLTQDRDEELVLFLELRHREKESDHNNKSSTTTMSSQGYTYRRTAADNFLYSENEKSDYDWLVTPPGSPSKSQMNQLDTNPMDLTSLLGSCLEEESDNISSKSQTIGLKRPSSSYSSRTTSRPSTPTKRSTAPTSRITSTSNIRSTSRPSTPTNRPSSSSGTSRATSIASRVTLTSSSTNSSRSTSRASTPTKRPSSSSGTSIAMHVTEATRSSRSISRPSTPTNRPPSSSGTSRVTPSSRSTSRPSTPTSRPTSSGTSRANLTAARTTTGSATSTRSNTRPMTAPSPKPGSRTSTPTRRPSTPTGLSTGLKSKSTKPTSIPAPSPILRSRPWEPYDMPGFSQEAPSNLRTTLPDRPQTASSRGTRASGASSASSSRSTSIEPVVGRRQSCSPSRNRAPIRNTKGAGGPLVRGRPAKTSTEDGGLSPVAIGNQKVERVVSTRKLAPPRLTENRGGSSAGFGRNLSQSSIDMALRHLGVKRGSMTGNLRPQTTKVPAGSMYSIRSSGTSNNRPVSSSGSSESSINILCLDGSDDNLSDISYS